MEYKRSSKSIVKGKKSIHSRGRLIVAVTRTIESPSFTTTEPFACKANLPVSIENNFESMFFSILKYNIISVIPNHL